MYKNEDRDLGKVVRLSYSSEPNGLRTKGLGNCIFQPSGHVLTISLAYKPLCLLQKFITDFFDFFWSY